MPLNHALLIYVTGHSIFKLVLYFFFKPGQFGAGKKHRSQVTTIQKQSLLFTDADIMSQSICLGLIRPKVSLNECLGYFLYILASNDL